MTSPRARDEPLHPFEVKKIVLRALGPEGSYIISRHAHEEMAKDGFTPLDCVNVLRAGLPQSGEAQVTGGWRYKLCTPQMTVVVAVRSGTEIVVVTAWRNKR